MPNGPRLCLRSFSCCLGARLRDLTFDVDPHDPSRMVDGTGRVLYYKGNLRMQYTVLNPHRRLQAITAEDDEWIVNCRAEFRGPCVVRVVPLRFGSR